MKTISAEQFKQRFGEAGTTQFATNAESQGGYLKQVAGAFKGSVA